MTQTALYRHYDAGGRLLYVGISIDPNRRFRKHSYESDWFDRVTTVKIERFATHAEAVAAERVAVRDEKPEHNSIKFQGRKRRLLPHTRALVTGDERPSWQMCRDIRERISKLEVVNWRTVEGCANRLLMDPEVLRDSLVFVYDKEVRLKRTDVFALADMVMKGELSQDNPWVVGRPLPAHLITPFAEFERSTLPASREVA
jgi:predicted GIY-YIG superfamily endonuclease